MVPASSRPRHRQAPDEQERDVVALRRPVPDAPDLQSRLYLEALQCMLWMTNSI